MLFLPLTFSKCPATRLQPTEIDDLPTGTQPASSYATEYDAPGQVNPGVLIPNTLLPLPITMDGKPLATSATLDANWRYIHDKSGTSCFKDAWDPTLCPDSKTCSQNCLVDGAGTIADHETKYGITATGNALKLKYITGTNVGSRMYLLDPSGAKYVGFNVVNKQISFTVDVSTLGCGLNGALYFSEMPLEGFLPAGAPYGTGYGDAQCPTDVNFVNGYANADKTGACANEYDVWEANSICNAFTSHTCSVNKPSAPCTGDACKDICDASGADYNSYRVGNKTLYGKGNQVDTSKPFEVITQFITSDGTDKGDLQKIQRFYVQDGKTIDGGFQTDAIAEANIKEFAEPNPHFVKNGGLKGMGEVFKRGQMVLVMSIWDDVKAQMKWLDSTYGTGPGAVRGPCPTNSGDINTLRAESADSYVTYSDIKMGPITATY